MNNEFDKFADTYDQILDGSIPEALRENAYFAEYKVAVMARCTRTASIKSILDFGCGSGRSMYFMHQYFPTAVLYGFDLSPASLVLAKQRMPQATLTTEWSKISLLKYDCIFAANVFHHIPKEERMLAMINCHNLLTHDGRFFLFEHNPFNPITRRIFERCPFDQDAEMLYKTEVETLAKLAGLKVIDSAYTLFFPKQLALLRGLEAVLRRLPFGAQYYVEFAKA
jgi:2-polyprenyl-3-methyl-5-hydroxy-6-metoxy-1,4-benzoquinol methylase